MFFLPPPLCFRCTIRNAIRNRHIVLPIVDNKAQSKKSGAPPFTSPATSVSIFRTSSATKIREHLGDGPYVVTQTHTRRFKEKIDPFTAPVVGPTEDQGRLCIYAAMPPHVDTKPQNPQQKRRKQRGENILHVQLQSNQLRHRTMVNRRWWHASIGN